jgi:hypothetical protein
VNHAIWTGVTAPLDLNPLYYAYTMQSSAATGATAIAQCSGAYISGAACTGAGTVLVKSSSGGRIVHINATINDSGNGSWAANADITKLMTNAVQWVTACQ